MRVLLLTLFLLPGLARSADYVHFNSYRVPELPFVPAPVVQVLDFWRQEMTCGLLRGTSNARGEISESRMKDKGRGVASWVVCSGTPSLDTLQMRELYLMRNLAYAHTGWGGFHKPWVRAYIQKQSWYAPTPGYTPTELSTVDRDTIRLLVKAELTQTLEDMLERRDQILAAYGQRWGDAPPRPDGTRACEGKEEVIARSRDCRLHGKAFPQAVPLDEGRVPAEARVEWALLTRLMGDFAVEEGPRSLRVISLDSELVLEELRQLSRRELRLLRNTVFARRGRPFKSELLHEHFSLLSWYKPDRAYTDKRLTETDRSNLALIQQVEGELGGALKDPDFRARDLRDPPMGVNVTFVDPPGDDFPLEAD